MHRGGLHDNPAYPAWGWGTSEAISRHGQIIGRSNYIAIWKLTDAGSKLYRDVMNAAG